jgi:hypothetical protein
MNFGRRRAAVTAAAWIAQTAGAAHARQPDNRAAAREAPDAAPPARNPPWRWRLTGTLIGPNGPTAVFATLGETRSLQPGEQIDGWTLIRVSPGQVTVTDTIATRSLTLEGFSPDEVAEAERQRAAEAARRNDQVRATLARQERDIAASQDALIAATEQMRAADKPP